MTIMEIILISLNLVLWLAFIYEWITLVKQFRKKVYIGKNPTHTLEHIQYICIYVFFLSAFWLTMIHNKVSNDIFLVLFFLFLSWCYLFKHIRKERVESNKIDYNI